MPNDPYWRIRPTKFVEEHVRAIAEREGRPLTNTLHKLLTEALFARERKHAQFEKLKELAAQAGKPSAALVATIRGAGKPSA